MDTFTSQSKTCGRCKKSIPLSIKVGDRCPHCGVVFDGEETATTIITSSRDKTSEWDWHCLWPFVPIFLFLATFALAGYWIVTNPQHPLPDPTLYEGIGANLATGNGYSFDETPPYRPELTRTPFLPFLISVLYLIIGRHSEAVLWMNAVWIGLAVALGYLLALRLFNNIRSN